MTLRQLPAITTMATTVTTMDIITMAITTTIIATTTMATDTTMDTIITIMDMVMDDSSHLEPELEWFFA